MNNVKKINTSEIKIIPFFDWHFGSECCNEELMNKLISMVREDDNCYAILGGDLIETSIYDGKINSVHKQKHQLQEQVELLIELLQPIKDKILFSVCGNHEFRVEKATGLDISALIAMNLDVPYFKWECHFLLQLKSRKSSKDMKNVYIYAHHGIGGGITTGAKANSMEKFIGRAPLADVLFSGHTHACMENRRQIRYLSQQGKLKNKLQYFISCGTLHESDGYASMKAYPAQPTSAMSAHIYLTAINEIRCDTKVIT